MRSCFFIGHRETNEGLLLKLESEIDWLMVDTCDWLVCYVRHGASNSRNLLEYAQRRERKGLIQITNIADRMGTNL